MGLDDIILRKALRLAVGQALFGTDSAESDQLPVVIGRRYRRMSGRSNGGEQQVSNGILCEVLV